MLDLRFLGDAGLLDAFGGGGDRLGLLRHLAIGENFDLVGVLGRLVVGVGIFFDIAVASANTLRTSSLTIPAPNAVIAVFSAASAVSAPSAELCSWRPSSLLTLSRASSNCLRASPARIMLFELPALLPPCSATPRSWRATSRQADRELLGQLVLLLLQRDEFVEILGVYLELLVDLGHPGATLGVLDLI